MFKVKCLFNSEDKAKNPPDAQRVYTPKDKSTYSIILKPISIHTNKTSITDRFYKLCAIK